MIMSGEHQSFEKKSLRKIIGNTADFDDIASECVGFANARGGHLIIGIEDNESLPPADQKINDSLVEQLYRRIPQITHNVVIAPRKEYAVNGGEFIDVEIFPTSSIAATSDGRYFLRVCDECCRLMPDDLLRLMNDKASFVWETQNSQQVRPTQYDENKRINFLRLIRDSERVSDFIKTKTDDEILSHYLFVKGGYLTNLGVLWIGIREDRASLNYAPAIQFIKYDETGRKVNKQTWDDFYLNPYELIEAVWHEIADWREYYEIREGLLPHNVPHYRENVIRELLANALVHRPYTQRGDIFLNLHPDRLEVHNPGLLPLGVTPENILHTSVARNEKLALVFRDLKLMEKEGSGYDQMYDSLLSDGKQLPKVVQENDRVIVTVRKQVMKPTIVNFVAKADETFQLTQKERISVGLLAQNESLTIKEMAGFLELKEANEVHHWLGRLQKLGVVKSKGQTRGKEYFIEPDLLRKLDFKGTTSLKTIEKYRLRELILKDLEIYHRASISEIHERIGAEIPIRKLRKELQDLVKTGLLLPEGDNKWRKYLLT